MEKSNEIKNRKEQMEKKKKRIIKIFIAIISIIIIGIVGYKLNDYIILDKNKTINLVINNRNVTTNLKRDILIENEEIYISKQDLSNFFDKYIYEDVQNNQIITTYDNKIAAISLDKNQININGSDKETYAHPIEKEDTIYIPIKELEDVYGIEIKYIENSKVLTIDSISKEQKKAIIAKNIAVKSSKRFIAKTIDRVQKGSYVVVISEEDGYARIRTENGKLGYVKSNKIANTVVVREEIQNIVNFLKLLHQKKESMIAELKESFFSIYETRDDIIKSFNLMEIILDNMINLNYQITSSINSDICDIIKANLGDISVSDLIFYLEKIVKFKNKLILVPNINLNLFMDRFVIEMSRCILVR